MEMTVRFLLLPLTIGLTLLGKALEVVAGPPDLRPPPVVVLDGVGPWADALDAL